MLTVFNFWKATCSWEIHRTVYTFTLHIWRQITLVGQSLTVFFFFLFLKNLTSFTSFYTCWVPDWWTYQTEVQYGHLRNLRKDMGTVWVATVYYWETRIGLKSFSRFFVMLNSCKKETCKVAAKKIKEVALKSYLWFNFEQNVQNTIREYVVPSTILGSLPKRRW